MGYSFLDVLISLECIRVYMEIVTTKVRKSFKVLRENAFQQDLGCATYLTHCVNIVQVPSIF